MTLRPLRRPAAPAAAPGSTRLLAAGLLAAGLVAGSCGRSREPAPPPAFSDPAKVVVLGFDGLEPAVIAELTAEGRLPNFARLQRQGAHGPLRSAHPLLSPVVWTTIATGREPGDHGITHFVTRNTRTGEELPVTSHLRRTRALWNLFSDAGRSVGVVGWWATWPAEKVRGGLVSDRIAYHFLNPREAAALEPEGEAAAERLPGLTYPADLEERFQELIRRPAEVGPAEVAPFARVAAEELAAGFTFGDDLSHLRWALAATATYRDIGLELARRQDPDLLMVYFEITDTLAHLFGHLYRRSDLEGDLAEQAERFGGAVEAAYELADEVLGSYLEVLGDDGVLMVLSDHGFELGRLHSDPSKARDLRRVSHEFHKLHGCLFLFGRGVRAGVRLEDASIYDVAPTVLALAGLPASREMSGEVLQEAFVRELSPPPAVATFETSPLHPEPEGGGAGGEVDQAVLEKLRSLGYIGGGDAPRVDRNLATLALKEGRAREAARMFHQLVQEEPQRADLRVDLAAALVRLGRDDDALARIAEALELAPDYPPAYFLRGEIHERQGQLEAAAADFRTAASYDDNYQAPRRALERLGLPVEERVATSPEERRSAELLSQARDAARRGDYPAAARALDEAEALTPRAAVVFQYRANVAYLQGDLAAAETALVRALELEPENALLRENLRRIREKS